MQKYDKSLIEVWEWKDKVYQDFKDLTVEEYVKKVREESDAIMAKHGMRLKRIKVKKQLQKTA